MSSKIWHVRARQSPAIDKEHNIGIQLGEFFFVEKIFTSEMQVRYLWPCYFHSDQVLFGQDMFIKGQLQVTVMHNCRSMFIKGKGDLTFKSLSKHNLNSSSEPFLHSICGEPPKACLIASMTSLKAYSLPLEIWIPPLDSISCNGRSIQL